MVAIILPTEVQFSISVIGPGGDAIGDLRVLGITTPGPFQVNVGATLSLAVGIANDNPAKAYPVLDADVVPDQANPGESVLSAVSASGNIAAGDQAGVATVVLTPLASVRGTKVGNYVLRIVVDDQ